MVPKRFPDNELDPCDIAISAKPSRYLVCFLIEISLTLDANLTENTTNLAEISMNIALLPLIH